MVKPTLFVLAAGMGSRYGGLKQLDGLGPHGETIMDYSIYDAIKSGFGKVVFVIEVLVAKLGFHVIDILLDFLLLFKGHNQQGVVNVGDDIALQA